MRRGGSGGERKGRTRLLVPFAAETEALPADGAFEERLLAGDVAGKEKKNKKKKKTLNLHLSFKVRIIWR